MSISLRCPKCIKEFRARDELAGKRVKCPACGQRFQVTPPSGPKLPPVPEPPAEEFAPEEDANAEPTAWEPEPNPGEPAIPDEPQPEYQAYPPAAVETGAPPAYGWPQSYQPAQQPYAPESYALQGQYAQWPPYGGGTEQPAGYPTFPVAGDGAAPPPLTSEAGPSVNVGLGAIGDVAFDRMMITYALQWAAITILLFVLGGVLAYLVHPVAGLLMFPAAIWLAYVCGASGIGCLAVHKFRHNYCPHWREAWKLVMNRAASLVLGALGVFILASLFIGFFEQLIYKICHIEDVGPTIGGFLIIPTFLVKILALTAFIALSLAPTVIGVENCSIADAVKILYRVVTENGFALYKRFFRALSSIIPFVLATGLATFAALAAAFIVCGGDTLAVDDMEEITFANLLQVFSIVTVTACWMAFVVVFATVSFTLVYCDSVMKVRVLR